MRTQKTEETPISFMNQERNSEKVLGQDGHRYIGHLRQEGITGGKI